MTDEKAASVTATSNGLTDRAGRFLPFTDDPDTTAPLHPWDGDDDGHNCAGCPRGGIWRCDEPAHPEHFAVCLTQGFESVYDDGTPNPCDCRIWRMFDPANVQRLVKERLRSQLEAHARQRAITTPPNKGLA